MNNPAQGDDDADRSDGRRRSDRDLTEGAVGGKLLGLAGPMMFGIAAVLSVQLVDTYFVGRLGTDPLAALSFAFPIALTLTSLAIGLSAGTASVVARGIGRRRWNSVRRRSTDALMLGAGLATVLAAIGLLAAEPLLMLLGAREPVLGLAVAYMRIWFVSLPFVVVTMLSNAMVRASGDSVRPSAIMVGDAAANVALTPLLVFGAGPLPALGIEGAALGTLLARFGASGFALWLVVRGEGLVRLRLPDRRAFVGSARRILAIGVPAALGNASNPAGMAVATALIAVLGSQTVAGFGVATRLEAFAILPMLALSSAIGPMTGQNLGANRIDRARRALVVAFLLCAGWSVLLAGVFAVFGKALAGIFASEPAVAEEAARYLHIVPISLWGYGVAIVAAGGFNGLGRPLTALGYSLTRILVFYVPLVWIASRIDGSGTVYLAVAIANALAGLAIAVHSLRWLRRAERATR
ncbi:MATE family efflux transporter [Wenzhouxiangella sp. XN79A]|uniref:MATE family efflux transporter n=1 Tax=Wenzhouxiangella sp. XN79A TaxID=2724193 RepID=UPI00144A5FE5|nr:MATE family efflux transporter [Wenzhouxiangella sp. XN79A]NKI35982.1 MATE family efflux transporter [Wenzhouxiangella sp. XN79A]